MSSIEHRWIDDDDLETTNLNNLISHHHHQNTIIESTTNLNTNESDIESNYDEEDEIDDDEDEDDEEYYDDNANDINYASYLDIQNSNTNTNTTNNNFILNGNHLASVGLRKKYKSHNKPEAGLWWDENEELNELTSSISFDFTNQLNSLDRNDSNTNLSNSNNNNNNCYEDDICTLKQLEKILNNSDLFCNNELMNENVTNININDSSNSLIATKNFKRLSLA